MTICPTASGDVQSDEWKYAGIGGWLILIVAGLCISPLLQLATIFTNIVPIFRNHAWTILTTPGNPAYHRLWAPLIIFETFINVLFITMEVGLLALLFRRSKAFPRAMIVYLLVGFVLFAADHFLFQMIPAVAENARESVSTLVRASIACAIWIPYFLVSKRVKGTFTR
jgi:hypothetical protein